MGLLEEAPSAGDIHRKVDVASEDLASASVQPGDEWDERLLKQGSEQLDAANAGMVLAVYLGVEIAAPRSARHEAGSEPNGK